MSAREEVRVPDFGFGNEAAQGHFGQNDRCLPAHGGFLKDLFSRPVEQVEGELGRRPETPAFDPV